jgi:hypothetical protein
MNAKGAIGAGALQGTAPLAFKSAMGPSPQRLSRALRLDVAARSVFHTTFSSLLAPNAPAN